MPKAPLPSNEQQRLAELRSFDILDTPEEETFDEIVRIAALMFDMPIALVSLVDEARQYFKARVGLDATETSRDLAFCAHTILEPDVMVVEDAQLDQRFSDNDLVNKDPHIRFYAGAPLITDTGNRLGTLCLIDTKPRTLSTAEADILQMLANRVSSEIKLRRANKLLRKNRDNINKVFGTLSDGVLTITPEGGISFIDNKAAALFKLEQDKALHRNWQDALQLSANAKTTIQKLIADAEARPVVIQLDKSDTSLEIRWAQVAESHGEIALIFTDVTELNRMRSLLNGENIHYGIVGRAPSIREVGIQIGRVAKLDIPLLVSGETGTGKDLVANAIHAISNREPGPFVAVNCGSFTESLLSSQLFGHKRGAFTGATEDQKGLFEAGSGGTVFLDEIADMPMDLQVNLLRVLDAKEVTRLGETKPRKVDFRLVSATNKNLQQLIAEGLFREDLYYRIRGLDIRMPPLRERREDIPMLLEHFAAIDSLANGMEQPYFTKNALATLMRYPWPGNVRQLRSVVNFAMLHSAGGGIRLADLPPEITETASQPEALTPKPTQVLNRVGTQPDPKAALVHALEVAQGNRSKAAKALGMSRATFYRRLTEYGITDIEAG